ncbi:hypothetical protein LTR03_011039 [Friedmanniomyces endolithicus]|nr:hypothetical protein LTR03_011039 [Friedmanniomyces endolithicus]
MPSLFSRKSSTTATNRSQPPQTQSDVTTPLQSPSEVSSPEKKVTGKSKGYFGKERGEKEREKESLKEKDRRIKSPRTSSNNNSKTFSRSTTSRRRPSDSEHPLNFHPDDPRRWSALSATMSSSSSPSHESGRGVSLGPEAMETSPAPETPGAFPMSGTNGVNGGHDKEEEGDGEGNEQQPVPPPHKTPASPVAPQQSAKPAVDAEACKAQGNKFYKAQQYDKAVEEYTKGLCATFSQEPIEADPQSSTYLSNRAAAYMAANRWVQALDDCKQADELEPGNSKILHRLTKVYTALGRPQEAIDVFDRIQPPATAKDRKAAQDMKTHIEQAQDSLRTGTSGSMVLHALDQAEKGLATTVSPPRKWRLMRGEAYLKMSNPNSLGSAQNIAMDLLRNNNQDPEALVLRGRALYGLGENDKAIQHFRQALQCDPDFKDAVKYLRMVQKLDRMKEEGNGHFKYGRYQQAVDVYTAALDVDPVNKGTNAKILNNRAMCHAKLKHWTLAREDCDRALALDPSYTKARKTRAKALGESGNWEEAVREYKNIAETSPEEPGIAKEVRNAEMELKKSKRKDYYKILGIGKEATEQEVKRAYRKLAVVHHPDKNPGDPDAEERFKDIQEAHETLIDAGKRERYDSGVDLVDPAEQFGGGGFGGMGGMGGGGMGGGMQIDPEVLAQLFGQAGGRGGGGGFSFGGGGGRSPFG